MPDTVEITVRGGIAYIGTIRDPDVMGKIQQGTSFKPAGIEYTTAYKRGRGTAGFDGRVKLVKHSKCPAGLLPRVINIIRDCGGEVALIDADTPTDHQSIETRLDDLQERFYQDDAVAMTSIFDRGVIRAPTGAGKTAIGAKIIHAKKKRAVVVVPTKDLLHQYKRFLTKHLRVLNGIESRDDFLGGPTHVYQNFEEIGQLGDGVVNPRGVTVATIRTIAKVLNIAYESYEWAEYDDNDDTSVNPRELQEWIESLGVVIVDEAHILGARMVYEITNGIPARCKYGMSASPWRDDGADLMIEAATGPVIFRIEPKTLVDHGFLVPPIIRVIPTSRWWTAAAWGRVCKRCGRQALNYRQRCDCGGHEFKSQFQECYKQEIVENEIRNQHIAEETIQLDCPTLVLVKQIKHGKLLQELIPDSTFLSGKETGEKRENVFDEIREGELQVIVATTIADMGMDIPNLQGLVLAGGGKSSTRHLQRIGRVVRPYEGKNAGVVLDFDDSHVHAWFARHEKARRAVEMAEWGDRAIWI